MNMSMIFGLEDEDPNAEAESQQSENTSSTEDEVEESEECGDDPAEATESFICESLGISPDELDYYSTEEYRENQVQSLEIGRLKGLSDDLGLNKAGRDMKGGEYIKSMRDKSTLFIHHIGKKFKSLSEAMSSSEVKRYIREASKWRKNKGYRVVKPADAIKAEPITFDSKNLRSIDGETIYISRRINDGMYRGSAYESHIFELKIVYVKNDDPNAEIKGIGKTMAGTFGVTIASIGKDKIKTKGFCAVVCQYDDQTIRNKNPFNTGGYR